MPGLDDSGVVANPGINIAMDDDSNSSSSGTGSGRIPRRLCLSIRGSICNSSALTELLVLLELFTGLPKWWGASLYWFILYFSCCWRWRCIESRLELVGYRSALTDMKKGYGEEGSGSELGRGQEKRNEKRGRRELERRRRKRKKRRGMMLPFCFLSYNKTRQFQTCYAP